MIKTEIKNLNEKIDDKFEGIEKNFDRQNNIIIACIGIPLGILAICVTVFISHNPFMKKGLSDFLITFCKSKTTNSEQDCEDE